MGVRAPSHSLIGVTIGNYRVTEKLGEGGMGAVYLAEHPLIGKRVALKVLHPEYVSNPDVVKRFFLEARAVNEIGHPNIVDVVDYGVVEGEGGAPGLVYFIMELLSGESLQALLEREGALPPDRAVAITLQIADALAASHDKGVIHRDLKPDNVFLIQRGRDRDFVKVLDFGIAKLNGGDRKEVRHTRSGVVMGTPTYMSPEQCESKRDLDLRSDVYSLGVMLYEMVTGEVPFTGEGYGEVILQHITRRPRLPSSIRPIPAPLEAIVLKAMEKRRDQRFASMRELIGALREPEHFYRDQGAALLRRSERAVTAPGRRRSDPTAATGPTMAASPTTLSRSAAELGVPARSRVPVIAASAFIVLALIAAGVALLGHRPEPREVVRVVAPPPPPHQPAPAPPPVPPAPVVERIPVAPPMATISITSKPPGAEVRVGDEVRGTTPMKLQLPKQASRSLEITLTLDGYRDRKKVVRLDRDTELYLSLRPHSRARRSKAPGIEPAGEPRPPEEKVEPVKESPPPEPEPGEDDVLPPDFGQ